MDQQSFGFDEAKALAHLRHYLPAQNALKDFVHHNTLHAFQHKHFDDALYEASVIFGYSTYLSIDEFRTLYHEGKIREDVLDRVLNEHFTTPSEVNAWKNKLLSGDFNRDIPSRLGQLRSLWKDQYSLSMDKVVYPFLLRLLSGFLDQGIAVSLFPHADLSFTDAVRKLDTGSYTRVLKHPRARKLLHEGEVSLTPLLDILLGEEVLYEQYLFDQQFSHSGWSGFVSVIENNPSNLLIPRKISLKEVVFLELLLEIDALDEKFGGHWEPLKHHVPPGLTPLFSDVPVSAIRHAQVLWQQALEWSYFNDVMLGIRQTHTPRQEPAAKTPVFQTLMCIDDRTCSLRRHLHLAAPGCETFSTPGFFGVEFYFQPEGAKFYTRSCPAPINPGYLIRETGRTRFHQQDRNLSKNSHGLVKGWLTANTLGLGSAVRLLTGILKPELNPVMSYSFDHMDKNAGLTIDSTGETEYGLQVGFTVEDMITRASAVLKSIGLTRNFAPLVYIIGHGGSSVNNTYYAGYECGACCGRPGSVNARVFAYFLNKPEVREGLREEGIEIPGTSVFVGALHDTTRDEIQYFDHVITREEHLQMHLENRKVIEKALQANARERSFRFDSIDSSLPAEKIHEKVKRRSVSLFEPRPEWNHTAAALTIVGRYSLIEHLYLDKRAFVNSYDYRQDPEGHYLLNILRAAVPVSGGIALEYYFSRVDQQKLGAGTKLPHNVVGLFAVANGTEGDLRPGLPSQMIEIHDPLRMHFILEQKPEVVLRIVQSDARLYEWILNEWVLLSVFDPETGTFTRFKGGELHPFTPLERALEKVSADPELRYFETQKSPVLIIEPSYA